jgi:hypothetical protein
MVAGKGSQPGSAECRLQDLGLQLPAAPTPFGGYVEAVQTGSLLFLSGIPLYQAIVLIVQISRHYPATMPR